MKLIMFSSLQNSLISKSKSLNYVMRPKGEKVLTTLIKKL